MKAAIFVILSLLAIGSQADEWTTGDKWRQGIYIALHIADWGQTRNIAKGRHGEHNILLGRYPSSGEVDDYFAATLVLHYVVAHAIPQEWREKFQYVTIGVQVGAVGRNAEIGYAIEF